LMEPWNYKPCPFRPQIVFAYVNIPPSIEFVQAIHHDAFPLLQSWQAHK
jgi:hypothetical protein